MCDNMTLAYSLAKPPQAPKKASGKQPNEAIGHVPSGRTMPTTPQKPERNPVVRSLEPEFTLLNLTKKGLFQRVD